MNYYTCWKQATVVLYTILDESSEQITWAAWQRILCNFRSGIIKEEFSNKTGIIWRIRHAKEEDNSSLLNYMNRIEEIITRSFKISTIVDAVASEAKLYDKTWFKPFKARSYAFSDTFSLFKQSIKGVT